MPAGAIHIILTCAALQLCGGFKDTGKLTSEYCLYPDDYFHAPETIGKYMFFTDGIQFHYLPDTPYNELYRYWKAGKSGVPERCMAFRNDNFRHADAGFRFYMNNAVAEWRNGRRDEAYKYLGCLLHMLEDSTFGIHALEGPDGTDIFALNRLAGRDIISQLCTLKCPEADPGFSGKPECLGGSVEEALPFLYARYVRSVRSSRQAQFRTAVELMNGTPEDRVSPETALTMRRNAVLLCADVLTTVRAIAEETAVSPRQFRLSELEPFEFPLGGGMHFGSFEIHGPDIVFGVHYSGRLMYMLPPGSDRFESEIRLDGGTVPVKIKVVNGGKVCDEFELSPEKPARHISVDKPSGKFGFEFSALKPSGRLILHEAACTR